MHSFFSKLYPSSMENPNAQNNMALVFPTVPTTVASSGSSPPNGHSSCDLLFREEGSCCPIVRTIRQEVSAMTEHFRAKELALLARIRQLEENEVATEKLHRDFRRLSDIVLCLRHDVDFKKLGCLQADS